MLLPGGIVAFGGGFAGACGELGGCAGEGEDGPARDACPAFADGEDGLAGLFEGAGSGEEEEDSGYDEPGADGRGGEDGDGAAEEQGEEAAAEAGDEDGPGEPGFLSAGGEVHCGYEYAEYAEEEYAASDEKCEGDGAANAAEDAGYGDGDDFAFAEPGGECGGDGACEDESGEDDDESEGPVAEEAVEGSHGDGDGDCAVVCGQRQVFECGEPPHCVHVRHLSRILPVRGGKVNGRGVKTWS